MFVLPLTPASFSDFKIATPVAIVLYIHSSDPHASDLLNHLALVASGFRVGIGFGFLDLSQPQNLELATDYDVAVTPLLAFYHYGSVIDSDVAGCANIIRDLTRENLVHRFGKSRSGATLIG